MLAKNAICSIKRLMGKSVKDFHKEGINCEIDNESEKLLGKMLRRKVSHSY